MVKFIKLALKNILRNRRRTGITILIISFGIIALILAGGFVAYSFDGLRESTIRGGLGHIQVYHEKYFDEDEDMPLQFGLENWEELKKPILAPKEVRFTMPRVEFMGLISNGDRSIVFIGDGIEPDKEIKLAGFTDPLREGKYLGESEDSDNEDEIILARGVAKSLKANIGDYLTLMTTTTTGALNAVDVKVVGIYRTGIPEVDARAVRVHLRTAQYLLNTNKISKLIVVLRDTENTDRIAETFSSTLPHVKLKTWYDLATFYRSVVRLYNSIFSFLGVIIFFVVLFSTSNTMMMSIFERVKEIGTILAIGSSRKRIMANFLYEGLMVGIIGGIVGVIGGFLIATLINNSGIEMPPPPGSDSGYPLFIYREPMLFLGSFVLTIVTAVISTTLPAFRASRMKIVDALGHE